MGVSAAVDVIGGDLIGGAAIAGGIDAAGMGIIGPTLLGAAGATEAALGAAAFGAAGAGAGMLGTAAGLGGLGLGAGAALGDLGTVLSSGATDYLSGGYTPTSFTGYTGAPGIDLSSGSLASGIGSSYSPLSYIGADTASAAAAAGAGGGSGLLSNLKNISNLASIGNNLYSGLFGPSGPSPNSAKLSANPFAPYQTETAAQLAKILNNPNMVYGMPGYAFAQEQGSQGVRRGAAQAGSAYSGNTNVALRQQGEATAGNWFNNMVNLYSGVTQGGASAGQTASTNQAILDAQAQANQQKQLLAGFAGLTSFFS